MRRWSVAAALAALGIAVGSGIAVPALGDGSASIDHVQPGATTAEVLASVPGDEAVDLQSVRVTIDGRSVASRARNASDRTTVRRVSVLAIDTSRSMSGRRIAEAKRAALAYLDAVPSDVEVGVVGFDSSVRVLSAPNRDRASARDAIGRLTLASGTALYDGIGRALDVLGPKSSAQRSLLVLSDGKDTTSTSLDRLLRRVARADIALDVISLQQDDAGSRPLLALAQSAGGQVIDAQDPTALTAAFSREADRLARQVIVSVTLPAGVHEDADLGVTLTAGGSTYTASALATVHTPPAPTSRSSVPIPVRVGLQVPPVALAVALVALGVGILGVLVLLIGGPSSRQRPTLTDHFGHYGAGAEVAGPTIDVSGSMGDQARQAAANVLAKNATLEGRIADRLEGAGVALRPSEWLLVHGGIAIGATLVVGLLARLSLLGLLLGLLLGVVGPWVWLGLKRSRRLRAFDEGLADTLQLMSGSLSAGLSLSQSVDTVVREGIDPIRSEFKRVLIESRLGVTLEDALEGVAGRMQSRDFHWVVMAVRIQREVGGNLAALLNTVAATLREREYLRRHVRALSAEGRLSCYVLGGLPPAFLAYLVLTKPDYTMPMFTTPVGWLMLTALVILMGVGMTWMLKVAKVEI